MGKEVNFGKLLHGGDYNPEQWLDYPEILEQDLAYFKKARINEVSLGMFSWAFLEPEEGVFRLEWLKEVIDRLYENEIVVMLSTPTAARPRWTSTCSTPTPARPAPWAACPAARASWPPSRSHWGYRTSCKPTPVAFSLIPSSLTRVSAVLIPNRSIWR